MNDDDTQLLQRLGGIAVQADPVPELVSQLGRAAFSLRQLDAELAELVGDSDVVLPGVRSSGSALRLLTFETEAVGVEVQLSGTSLLGQVSAPASAVRLETASLEVNAVSPDEFGNFRFDGIASGSVRLVVRLVSGNSVVTSWFRV
jgi:hypothetical protein